MLQKLVPCLQLSRRVHLLVILAVLSFGGFFFAVLAVGRHTIFNSSRSILFSLFSVSPIFLHLIAELNRRPHAPQDVWTNQEKTTATTPLPVSAISAVHSRLHSCHFSKKNAESYAFLKNNTFCLIVWPSNRLH